MASKLGYWDIRGLAQPLRLILAYVEEEFEDVRYKVGPAPEYSRDDWFNVKFKLGLAFPNLPYYMDDEVKITNTNAIFRYLGRKHNLAGGTEKEKVNCDMALEVIMDLRNGFVQLCYGSTADKFKENKEAYIQKAKVKLSSFNDYLGEKPFFIGPKVTVCDFHLYEMLDQHLVFDPTILDDFPKLKEYCQRFEALPIIKDIVASDTVKATPINNVMALFK